jgi:heptaprenyl diphosphate synthase
MIQVKECDIPQISQGLAYVEDELLHAVEESDDKIRDILSGLFDGGKRIRPRLVLLSGMCFGELDEKMIHAAVAAELIHTASLVHDDIIDMSDYRRNNPTINSIFGNHIAVLAGDFLFAKAFEILSEHEIINSMLYFVNAIQNMCSGEIIQSYRRFDISITEQDYMDYIDKKTASLICACCMAGAQSAGAGSHEINLMGSFGYKIGRAFQITDDILDITGDKKTLGKSVGQDITEGDISLPFIYLLAESDNSGRYADKLNKGSLNEDLKQILINDAICSGAVDRAQSKARQYVDEAVELLYEVPHSIYRQALIALALNLIDRQF